MKLKDNKDSIIHIRTSYLEKKELIRKAKEQGFKDVSKFIRFKLELK